MCGGFSIISKEKKLFQRFHAEPDNFSLQPRYNARPGQDLPVILGSDPHKIILAHWGYLPHWAVLPKPQPHPDKGTISDIGTTSGARPRLSPLPRPQINARAETIAAKPFYKESFLRRRCLIPADSFFEWGPALSGPVKATLPASKTSSASAKPGSSKQPYRILLKTGEPFAFAGIWDEIRDHEGTFRPAFAIITVEANKDVAPIHDRMPAILLPEEEAVWLAEIPRIPPIPRIHGGEIGRSLMIGRSPGIKPSTYSLAALLHPYPNGLLTSYPVSKLVNSAAHDSPEVIKEF